MGPRASTSRSAARLTVAGALGLVLACNTSAGADVAQANVAAAPDHEQEANLDPAALYDPPTVDANPPPDFGQNKSAPDFPDVVLTTHEGKQVNFYEDLVKEKIVFINFMYATCTGT